MGEARRRRLAAAKTNLKLIQGGLAPVEVPAPVPPVPVVDLHILVPKDTAEKLDAAHAYVQNKFETRNDFLCACLDEALMNFGEALRAAIEKKKLQDAQGSITLVRSVKDVENMPPPPGGEVPGL